MDAPQAPNESVRRRFAKYGVFGGVSLGALLGALYSGPNLREWGFGTSLAVTLGFAVGGLVLGYIGEIAAKASMADAARGSFGDAYPGIGSGHQDSSDDHSSHSSGGGDGGGDAGC